MKLITQITLGLFLFATPFLSISQEESKFTDFITHTFEKSLNDISNGASTAPFLKSFSPELVWTNVNVGIDGGATINKYNKEFLSKKINHLASSAYINVKWEILVFNELIIREDANIATFEVSISVYAGEELLSKGKNIVEIVAKKAGESYAITYVSVLQILNESYRGKCYVDIDIKKENESTYTTRTYYPNGSDYSQVTDTITLIGKDKLQVIKVNQSKQTYYWNTLKGNISLDKDGSRVIGNTHEIDGVILAILKNRNNSTCQLMIKSARKSK